MSLKIQSAIAEHPIAAVFSSAIAMFGIALGVVAWLYQERIANVTAKYEAEIAVLRARLDRTEGGNKPEANRSASIDSSTVKALVPKVAPAASTISASSENPLANQPVTANQPPLPAAYADVFSAKDPYPIEHSRAKIGVRLSALKLIYPDGKAKSWGYDIELRDGPFSAVTYWMDDEVLDPPSNRVTFTPRNESARKAVWASAATAFQGVRHSAIKGGIKLVWHFKGLTATLDEDGYHLDRDDH